MRLNVNSKWGCVTTLAIFFLIPLMGILFTAGIFLLSSAGGEYFKEIANRKKYTEKVTAIVKDVDCEDRGDKTTGYQTISYEYNGKQYETKIEYYVEASGEYKYSTDGKSSDSSKRDDSSNIKDDRFEDKSAEHWQDLKDTIGKEEEVLINPKDPSHAVMRTTDKVQHALGVMTLIGVGAMTLFIIIVIILIIIVRKIIKTLVANDSEDVQQEVS